MKKISLNLSFFLLQTRGGGSKTIQGHLDNFQWTLSILKQICSLWWLQNNYIAGASRVSRSPLEPQSSISKFQEPIYVCQTKLCGTQNLHYFTMACQNLDHLLNPPEWRIFWVASGQKVGTRSLVLDPNDLGMEWQSEWGKVRAGRIYLFLEAGCSLLPSAYGLHLYWLAWLYSVYAVYCTVLYCTDWLTYWTPPFFVFCHDRLIVGMHSSTRGLHEKWAFCNVIKHTDGHHDSITDPAQKRLKTKWCLQSMRLRVLAEGTANKRTLQSRDWINEITLGTNFWHLEITDSFFSVSRSLLGTRLSDKRTLQSRDWINEITLGTNFWHLEITDSFFSVSRSLLGTRLSSLTFKTNKLGVTESLALHNCVAVQCINGAVQT